MGLLGFIIENTSRETAYKVGTVVWEYSTLGRAYNALYYGITYGWRYRQQLTEKTKEEFNEAWEKHHISDRIEYFKNKYTNYVYDLRIKYITY